MNFWTSAQSSVPKARGKVIWALRQQRAYNNNGTGPATMGPHPFSMVDAEPLVGGGPAIVMNLTARSALGINAGIDDVLRGLDLCHDEVVSAFVDLTESDRHLEWGRTS
jgi:hypothetical protein